MSALTALAYVVLPRHRDKLRWPTLGIVLLATVSIWAAYLTGEDFLDSDRFSGMQGEARDLIERHEDLAGTLRLVTSGFAILTLAATSLHHRTGPLRIVLGVLVAVGAIATLVWTVMTGDAGAKAVWG